MAANELAAEIAFAPFANLFQNAKRTIGDITHTNLQRVTPVDTGFTRDNWLEEDDGVTVTISNDTEYLPELDDGHSKQAPANFVTDTITESAAEAEVILQREVNAL